MRDEPGPDSIPAKELPRFTEDGLTELLLGLSFLGLGIALLERSWLAIALAPLWLVVLILWILPTQRQRIIPPRLPEWWRGPAELPEMRGAWILVVDGLAVLLLLAPLAYGQMRLEESAARHAWLGQWGPLFLSATFTVELFALSYRVKCRRYRTLSILSLLIGISAWQYPADHELASLGVLFCGLGLMGLVSGVITWDHFARHYPLPWERM